jgi:hypothetical protein
MDIPTYDLRRGEPDATAFYRTLEDLADRVLEHAEARAGALLSAYAAFCASRGEAPRGRGEYVIELLTLGAAWLRYGGLASRTPRTAVRLCAVLCRVRRRLPALKPWLDPLRGRLASRCLLAPGPDDRGLPGDTRAFRRLIEWLEASGEFKDEAKRLRTWLAFACRRGSEPFASTLSTALDLARWCEGVGRRTLGEYTSGVAAFRREHAASDVGREDRIFRGKSELEYHLSMLSSELTNRGLRASFQATARRVVLLPACMRGPGEGDCRAQRRGEDLLCGVCSGTCAIGRVTRLGRRVGFETRIIPHSSGFTRSLLQYQGCSDRGVVAVACALNIVPGGYEMRELRIPSQCVLLDYCGCRRHWHPTGIPTDLSDERLLATVAARAPLAEEPAADRRKVESAAGRGDGRVDGRAG